MREQRVGHVYEGHYEKHQLHDRHRFLITGSEQRRDDVRADNAPRIAAARPTIIIPAAILEATFEPACSRAKNGYRAVLATTGMMSDAPTIRSPSAKYPAAVIDTRPTTSGSSRGMTLSATVLNANGNPDETYFRICKRVGTTRGTVA